MSGNSLGDAWVDATDDVIDIGYGEYQFPMIDDNHDGLGHGVNDWGWIALPHGGDGLDALDTYICKDCPNYVEYSPVFLQVPLKTWLGNSPSLVSFPVLVKVDNETDIAQVTCRVTQEDWIPPDPPDPENLGGWVVGDESLFQWNLTDIGGGDYSARIDIPSPVNDSDYKLCFFVYDTNGNRGPVVSTYVGFNQDGIAPLDTVGPTIFIKRPSDNETVEGLVEIIAEGIDDNSGLDQIQIYVNDELKDTTDMPDYLPYPAATYTFNTTEYENGALEITAKGIDVAGNTNNFSISVNVNNTGMDDTSKWYLPPYDLEIIAIGAGIGIVAFVSLVLIRKSRKRHRKRR